MSFKLITAWYHSVLYFFLSFIWERIGDVSILNFFNLIAIGSSSNLYWSYKVQTGSFSAWDYNNYPYGLTIWVRESTSNYFGFWRNRVGWNFLVLNSSRDCSGVVHVVLDCFLIRRSECLTSVILSQLVTPERTLSVLFEWSFLVRKNLLGSFEFFDSFQFLSSFQFYNFHVYDCFKKQLSNFVRKTRVYIKRGGS